MRRSHLDNSASGPAGSIEVWSHWSWTVMSLWYRYAVQERGVRNQAGQIQCLRWSETLATVVKKGLPGTGGAGWFRCSLHLRFSGASSSLPSLIMSSTPYHSPVQNGVPTYQSMSAATSALTPLHLLALAASARSPRSFCATSSLSSRTRTGRLSSTALASRAPSTSSSPPSYTRQSSLISPHLPTLSSTADALFTRLPTRPPPKHAGTSPKYYTAPTPFAPQCRHHPPRDPKRDQRLTLQPHSQTGSPSPAASASPHIGTRLAGTWLPSICRTSSSFTYALGHSSTASMLATANTTNTAAAHGLGPPAIVLSWRKSDARR